MGVLGIHLVNRGRRGLTGLSAMIILIAVVLTASIAAFLVINYSVSISTDAVDRKIMVERGVVNGVEIVSLLATDGSQGKDLEHFELVLRLKAGSGDLGLVNNTLIVFTTPYSMQSLVYNNSAGDTSDMASTTATYNVEWLSYSSDYEQGYLKRGDLIKVRFSHRDVGRDDSTGGVGESVHCRLEVIPRTGLPTHITLYTPNRINQYREGLWPKESKL